MMQQGTTCPRATPSLLLRLPRHPLDQRYRQGRFHDVERHRLERFREQRCMAGGNAAIPPMAIGTGVAVAS